MVEMDKTEAVEWLQLMRDGITGENTEHPGLKRTALQIAIDYLKGSEKMSVDLYRWDEDCRGQECPGDCDRCTRRDDLVIVQMDALFAPDRMASEYKAMKRQIDSGVFVVPNYAHVEYIGPKKKVKLEGKNE